MRIMTGAALPSGADAVVMVEDTRVGESGQVAILEAILPHRNYRDAGEDVTRGEVVVEAGTAIRPAELAMLAAVGQSQVPVFCRPRVALIATGDELVEVTEVPPPGKIRDSNTYSMIGQVVKYGGVIDSVHRAVDTIGDLLLTSGGVSVGDYDLVKDVMLRRGEILFWGLAIKPGRPLAFGRFGSTFFFGLPGYPVSGMVTFEQFVRLALLRMQGRRYLHKPVVRVRLSKKYKASPGKVDFLRVNLVRRDGEYWAELAGVQGSGRLSSMVRANGLLIIPEDVVEVNVGDVFDVQLVDAPEIL
jgi:molybdopterin molybdotransferase